MAVDLSIWNNALRPARSVADYDAENQDFQKNQLNLQTQRQGITDANALRAATAGFGNDQAANYNSLLKTGNINAATSYQKALMDQKQGQSVVDKNNSEVPLNTSRAGEQDALAKKHALDTSIAAHDYHIQQLGALTDPSQVPAWVNEGVKNGVFTFQQANAGLNNFQQAMQQPGGFAAWKQQALQGGVSATEQLKQQQQLLIANQAQAGENSRSAASNATHVQTAGMAQAGENSRAALGRQAQFKVAGLDANGNFAGGDSALGGLVDAIGQGKVPEGTALARTPPAMKAQIMQSVAQKYPDYDPTRYAATQAANKAFTTGPQGNSMRSFAVADQHLDQLGQLADALNNKDTQAINKVGNFLAAQTGSPAPTNFDAAKNLVSKEVMKAIVAGGGGVGEREELQHSMDKANSPAQLKGVIQQYRNLMGAQHDALLQQRRAAGLPDSTLPAYAGAAGSSPAKVAIPDDIAAILQKHGAQ